MPNKFLLSYVSFDDENQPFIDAEVDGEISRLPILGENLSLEFDFSKKYCVGWVDFEKRCSMPCPDSAEVDVKYESCLKCRNKTGFNPAFYHADSVSEQQEKINQQPHFVYLAYFSPDVIKVGISQESRGIRRVLEQGARLAVKLETFPSALIARQYEDQIAHLDRVVETVNGSKKMELLKQPFDIESARANLETLQKSIEKSLGLEFESAKLIETDQCFTKDPINTENIIDMSGKNQLAGEVVAMIGPIAILKYQSELLAYNLKRLIGYRAEVIRGQIDIDLPTQQMTLF